MALTTRVLTGSDIEPLRTDWERLIVAQQNTERPALDTIHPDWFTFQAGVDGTEQTAVIVAWDNDQVVGLLPHALRPMSLDYEIGYRRIARAPLKTVDVLCPGLLAANEAAGAAMIDKLVDSYRDRHLINFDKVPVASQMWRHVHNSAVVKRHTWTYHEVMEQRRWIQLDDAASLDGYLTRFKSKTRNTLRRKRKKLLKTGTGKVSLHRLHKPEHVERCNRWLAHVADHSWQGKVLGDFEGLDDPKRLAFLAQQGWLCAYFLHDGNEPISFVIGRLIDGVFHYDLVGYHIDWAKRSAGIVLLMMIIEDLLAMDNPPRIFDFGPGDADYKEQFSSDAFEEGRLWVIPHSVYSGAAFGLFVAQQKSIAWAKQILEQLGVIERLRALRRRWRSQKARDA